MTELNEKLSAFLDGELSAEETREVEAALASDPDLMRELEALMAADTLAKDAFGEIGNDPVPLNLAAAIKNAPEAAAEVAPRPVVSPRSRWSGIAAALALFLIGGTGGYFWGQSQVPPPAGWLAAIADYHAVYVTQERHLVEVAASEANHIETWLSNTIGADVRIPDLAESGLTFEGARLLVAAGKPVAQLMFTDAAGHVVALCAIGTASPQDGFRSQNLNGFDMVSWGDGDANFVVVGDEGRTDLQAIAETAATQV